MTHELILGPRYQSANAMPPGDPEFWAVMLDNCDNCAFVNARDNQGGPFGAQLWLVNPDTDKYVLAGDLYNPVHHNAVVSKGIASAHAEAENLCPDIRWQVVDFLDKHKGEGWRLVQVSSAESCQSCRAKQILFAEELVNLGLIEQGGFHVVFKVTCQQSLQDAGFYDALYDMAFRAIESLGLLDEERGLFDLEDRFKSDPVVASLIDSGEIVYNPVSLLEENNINPSIKEIFDDYPHEPVAVVVARDGKEIISTGYDERDEENDHINQPEKTAIISALHKAAEARRQAGEFESWDLEGASLITNIADIGPLSYAESLWYNLSGISVVDGYGSEEVELRARELPWVANRELFRKVAAEYDSPDSHLSVRFMGDPDKASVAHLYWAAHIARENMLSAQAKRLQGFESLNLETIGGDEISPDDLIETSNQNSHYNGRGAGS
jgi:deoxycytidylate deaminase